MRKHAKDFKKWNRAIIGDHCSFLNWREQANALIEPFGDRISSAKGVLYEQVAVVNSFPLRAPDESPADASEANFQAIDIVFALSSEPRPIDEAILDRPAGESTSKYRTRSVFALFDLQIEIEGEYAVSLSFAGEDVAFSVF